jgi:hypothetical protein
MIISIQFPYFEFEQAVPKINQNIIKLERTEKYEKSKK